MDAEETAGKRTRLLKAYEGKDDYSFEESEKRVKALIIDTRLMYRLLYNMMLTPQNVSESRDALLQNLMSAL